MANVEIIRQHRNDIQIAKRLFETLAEQLELTIGAREILEEAIFDDTTQQGRVER